MLGFGLGWNYLVYYGSALRIATPGFFDLDNSKLFYNSPSFSAGNFYSLAT